MLSVVMESRFRYRFFGPYRLLTGAGILPGQSVLEVGCGTGYFTLPAASLIGNRGCLVALDILADSVELVTRRVKAAGLENVCVIKRDAMDTGLEQASFDTVLLFGVIPAPVLPLTRLLPEMHRVLKGGGILAVWPPIPGWLPGSIRKSGLFKYANKVNGVLRFRRSGMATSEWERKWRWEDRDHRRF